MERLAVIAAAGAALLVPPVRDRLIPVSKAVGRAGFGLAGTLITGARDVAEAALHGEPTSNGATRSNGRRAPAKTTTKTATKGPAGTASKAGGSTRKAPSRSSTAKRTTARKRS